ncbi:MAG TPA: periplasmic heavy metal sensor, partial [Candidatus Polarisedimenticolia bacterium]|nr:periplasmic heavy metal sensor [Candidatus Polarisedimenticolia bacterium]
IASLAVAGLLTLGAAAAAPRFAEHGFGGGGFGLHRVLADLNLSDDQKESLKAILKDERSTIEPLLDRKMTAHKALFEAIHAATLDESAVRSAAKKAAAADVDLAVEKAVLFSKMRGILSDEQRVKVDALLERLEAKVGKRIDLGRSIWREHAADFIDAL